MKRSEQLNELATAMSAAQAEMEHASKAKVNPHFKSKYADLSAIWDAVREPLTKHGLSVVQLPSMTERGEVSVTTIVMHKSGQFIEAEYALPAQRADAQGFGSAITYMKRYALTGVGVAPDDDDGNAASVPVVQFAPEGVTAPPKPDKKAAANKWGNDALAKIPAMTPHEYEVWASDKLNRNGLGVVRECNEALHKRLNDAMLLKQRELVPAAAE